MKRLASAVLGFILIVFFIYRKRVELMSVAGAVVYTTVFSLLLSPVCTRLEKQGMRPAWAAGCAVLGLSFIAFAVVAAIIPYLITRADYLFKRITPAAASLMELFISWKEQAGLEQISLADSGSIVGKLLSTMTGKMVRAGMTAMAQIGRIGFSLVLTYYVLCDRKRIACHLLLLVPIALRKQVLTALHACRNALISYLSGLLKTSAFVAAATGIGLWILGVQDVILLSLLMGALEILPYLGPILAAIPILLSAMLQGGNTLLFTLIMLVLVQQIEGNFVSPYFTASSTSVHPLSAIFAVFVMGILLGVWGILLAVPTLVLIQSLVWSFKQIRNETGDCALS